MKYLITGGAGFIGSHLTENLIKDGQEVFVLDNLSTGSYSNLASINERVHFVQGNILDSKLVHELISKCEYVVHFAAALGVINIVNKPLESLLTNLK